MNFAKELKIMFESFKNPKTQKNPNVSRVNKATVITFISLVLAVGVIVVAAVASNRAKKKDELPDTLIPNTQTPGDTQKPDQTPTEVPDSAITDNKTETGTQNNDQQTSNKLPTFILPVSGSLSSKHDPTLQVFSPTMNDYRVHLGIDITTDEAAPVYAAADGKISKIWSDTLMGYCIAIEHSGDCFTIYKNLSEELPEGITVGAKVRSGQLIASVGESAMVEVADEPHLHFEMTVGDLAVDPLEYFDKKALEALSIDASFGE